MTDDDDWNVPVKAPVAGAGRGRGIVRPAAIPASNPVNANDSWALPGSKPAAPQGADSSWDTSVYQGQPKPTPTLSTPVADHSWDDPAPGTGRGVTAGIAAVKIDDDWGNPTPRSVPAGTELPTPSVLNWESKTSEQPRGASWGTSNGGGAPRGGGGGGRNCHKCGEEGHMSRECPQGGGGSRACFKCNQEGHMSRDCPSGGGGGGPRTCHKCGQEGHMSRDCPSGGGGGGGGPRTCHKCGEEGHMSRDCPSGGGGGGGSRACHKCGEEGHMSRECPTGGGSKGCRKCGEEGHMARECPNAAPDKCFKCNEEGHMSRDCPKIADGPPRACYKCHSMDHQSKDCDLPVSELTADGKPREQYTPQDVDEAELFKGGIASGNNFSNFDKVALQLTGDDVPDYIRSFEEVGLRTLLLENIKASGYTKPTPVQRGAIPCILKRRDVMACAVTGSGKTAAYLVPVINTLLEKGVDGGMNDRCQKPEVVIIAPTRELATQIFNEARKFSNRSVLKTVILYGGTVVSQQRQKLQGGCNILVATPGRLKGFIEDRCLDFSNVQFLILDEADRMLDDGFKDEILAVATNSTMPPPGKRQTLLFSATFPTEIQELAKQMTHNYVFVATGTVGGTNPDVNQDFFEVSKPTKRGVLEEELKKIGKARTIIFVESKKTADFLASYLCNAHFSATSIHGDRLQSQREQALRDFKSDRHNILVATNVAARGLDIPGVEYVINYELPKDVEEYVHRIGRTGRVGNLGRSISFFDPEFDSDKAGPIVSKLVASGADVPPFLQQHVSGVGGMGYNFDAPSQSSGFGARDTRTFAAKPVEQEESWD